MKGVILGHKLTPTEDKRFSETVCEQIRTECMICRHKMNDERRYTAEERTYYAGRYEVYCKILSDMIVPEDTRIRGRADAYNEIVYMLNCFALSCKNGVE